MTRPRPSPAPSTGIRASGLLVGLFLSGLAALLYQVAWIQRASLVFGSTTFAVGSVVAVFFGGLGLGSYLFGRRAEREARPMRRFGQLELALALLAALSLPAFDLADAAYGWIYSGSGDGGVGRHLARVGLLAVVLLPPTVCMGASLPLFCRQFVGGAGASASIGRRVGWLYALNTLGAAAGAALAGGWLVPAFGWTGTLGSGVGLNLVVGGLALALRLPALEVAPLAEVDAGSAGEAEPSPRGSILLAALLFAVSFVALGLEVLWTRHLSLLVRHTVTTYSLTLTVVLLGIVLGSALVAPWLDRMPRRARVFGALQLATAVAVLWLMGLGPGVWGSFENEVAVCFLLFLPAAVLSGASFPLAIRMVVSEPRGAALGTGRMAAVSSLGGIVGSLGMGLVGLPELGLQGSLRLVTGVSVAVAILCWWTLDHGTKPLLRGLWSVVALALWFFLPLRSSTRLPQDFLSEPELLVDFREGHGANLAVVRAAQGELRLEIDRWWQGSDRKNHQILAAHLPMLLVPEARRVLVVGLGTGQTASRFLMHDVERLDVIDIEPTLFEFVERHFPSEWMRDGRVGLLREDGRSYLSHSAERYDVLSIEVGQAFRPGVAYFYTEDFYRDARERLTEGGCLVQFVPLPFFDEPSLRTALRTFLAVFPAAQLWYNTAELLLVGTRGESAPSGSELFATLEARPAAQRDLAYAHWGGRANELNRREVLAASFLMGPEGLAKLAEGGALLRDDRPRLDYVTRDVLPEDTRELETLPLLREHLDPLPGSLAQGLDAEQRRAAEARRLANLGQIEAAAEVRLAEAQRTAGDHRAALVHLERALAANPRIASVHLLLGDSLMFLQQVERAQGHFASAVDLEPEDGRARFGLGVTLLQLGRFAESVPHFEAALAAKPDDHQALNALGVALDRLGDPASARRRFEEALRARPDFADARRNLERVMRAPAPR